MPPVVLISAIPTFVSPEQHRELIGTTPASFNDIPPVLRHREDDLTVVFDPPLDGFSLEDCAKGTLYIVESVLAFVSASGRGFQVEYPSITLHAISRTDSGPCIYCQLDEAPVDVPETPAGEDDLPDMRELKLIPQTAGSLESMFEALSLCASLHPDKATGSDDDMGLDDAFVDADEQGFEAFTGDAGQELSEVGRAARDYLESIIDDPRNQLRQANGNHHGRADGKDASDGESSDGAVDSTTRQSS